MEPGGYADSSLCILLPALSWCYVWLDGGNVAMDFLADTGKVGAEITQERAKELAEICALNCLAAVELVAPVNMIVKVVRVVCYVNGAPGFLNQPFVANGASELFMHIWGDAGIAARSAIGVAELPLNSPVEIELTVEIAELRGSSANAYLGGQHQQSILNDRPA